MSLATRCSACSTVFRVQKDQLKASEGWVRCGRCGTVFSALEGLFDLERESHSGPMPLHGTPVAPPTPPAVPPPSTHADVIDDEVDQPSTQILVREQAPPHGMPVRADTERAERAADRAAAAASFLASQQGTVDDDEDDAAYLLTEHGGSHTHDESRPLESRPLESRPLESRPLESRPMESRPLASRPMVTGPMPLSPPSFLRDAERAARWYRQRPVVRRLTIAAAVVLPLLLGAQIVLHHRDMVAARWPGSSEVLRAVCTSLDCVVQAPRHLESLTIESSGFTRVEAAPLYRLQVSLRNRAPWAVAMPALELTLTDSRGDIVTRRVLRAADLGGAAPAELGAGAEWSALATLDLGERRVSGYTIDLFYP